jgi:outer membrane cobalamin receptor
MEYLKYYSLLLLILLLFCGTVNAQTGSLSGIVLDEDTKEPVIGVYVLIKEFAIGATTDLDGRYLVRNVPEGVHVVTVTSIGYNTVTVTGVVVGSGSRINLDFVLQPGSAELEEVTVTAYRQLSTVSSVLMEVKKMSTIVSGISNQQITRSQDSNAAQVMQRVPGVTIVENRFVMIRGLSERYNSVMINNVQAPSTEVDKRTFSFDLISSGSLDKMLIYKSGNADMPGDFAGGVIKLFTIDDVESNFVKINYGIGYRTGTTGRNFLQSDGSSTDIIGFDNGFRALPSNFPATRTIQNSPRNSPMRIEAAHTLPNNFDPANSIALIDQSVGFTIGRSKQIGQRVFSNITTINYSTGFQYFNKEFYRYFEWTDQNLPIVQRFAFQDDNYQQDVKLNLMTNWKYKLSEKSRFSFKNLFNQIGENETIIRSGKDFIQRPDDDLKNYMLGYKSRSIYSGQLEGNHNLTNRNYLNWVVGGSFLNENEPDLRRFRTFRSVTEPNEPFSMQMPPSSNLFDTGRFYGKMFEYSINNGVDYQHGFSRGISYLKTGYQVDYRYRDYNARYISYLYPGFFDPNVRETLIRLPLNQIFSPENLSTSNGFVIEEGTRPIDSYSASSLTSATYLSVEIPINSFNIITGTRLEFNNMKLNSNDDFGSINVDNQILTILPFFNSTYSFTEKTQVRLAYGRTLNRPEFRELAPFVFYDYKMDAGRAGNPNLKQATIDNLEIRIETYPRIGETMTFGVFYKYFNDPIENKTFVTTESPQFSYINADYAFSYGTEIEVRKSLQGMTASSFIDRFSLNANASLIFTTVNLGDAAVAQQKKRPLQGQSPFIINSALYYDDLTKGFNASMTYNIIGTRIYSVGDVLFPTIYELPRHSLDLTASKTVGSRATLKFGIQDVLDSAFRFYQDSDRNEKIDVNTDHPIFVHKKGMHFNVTLSYDF